MRALLLGGEMSLQPFSSRFAGPTLTKHGITGERGKRAAGHELPWNGARIIHGWAQAMSPASTEENSCASPKL